MFRWDDINRWSASCHWQARNKNTDPTHKFLGPDGSGFQVIEFRYTVSLKDIFPVRMSRREFLTSEPFLKHSHRSEHWYLSDVFGFCCTEPFTSSRDLPVSQSISYLLGLSSLAGSTTKVSLSSCSVHTTYCTSLRPYVCPC
jgi:hypothetical protein